MSEDGNEQESEGVEYARGVVHRLATEEWHQERQPAIIDYWHRPTGERVVQEMIDAGWDEDVAKDAVRGLWTEQMRSLRSATDQCD